MVSVRHLPGPTHGKAGAAVTTLLQFLRDLLLAVLAPRAALRIGRINAGSRWTLTTMRTGIARQEKRVGLRRTGWHVLRHSFCSHLAGRGVAAVMIKKLAGHSSIAVTRRSGLRREGPRRAPRGNIRRHQSGGGGYRGCPAPDLGLAHRQQCRSDVLSKRNAAGSRAIRARRLRKPDDLSPPK
jgi:hypothetical protein